MQTLNLIAGIAFDPTIRGILAVLVGVVSSYLVDFKVLEASDGPLLEVVKAGGVAFPPMLFAAIALFANLGLWQARRAGITRTVPVSVGARP